MLIRHQKQARENNGSTNRNSLAFLSNPKERLHQSMLVAEAHVLKCRLCRCSEELYRKNILWGLGLVDGASWFLLS